LVGPDYYLSWFIARVRWLDDAPLVRLSSRDNAISFYLAGKLGYSYVGISPI